MSRIIGIILIVVGVALAWWGFDIYDSASSQFRRAFDGETPWEAWAGMVGGGICFLLGLFKVK
ncbi:DUF3185 family protein [Alteromonas ponticola]|uniref:DUF3185 family protein n=1 Tax=Alteromonas aquimaris TaxID=2998417 RepID=A0ABT3P371_9ALTE|nr:DUF3185 family protein [Alteromonas aquimaris]MCW8107201.1 DUF3185 family protein [Alteromonas aquimaris]